MNENEQSAPELVQVQSLDEFVRLIAGWHATQVQRAQHMLTVPEGATFTVGEGPEAQTIELTGASLAAFKLGVEMVLMQLGQLPFVAETEEAEPTPDVPQ